jgi:hypothetical protein
MKTLPTALVLTLVLATAHAEEGMWLPEQLAERADELRSLGLELDPAELGDLEQAPLGAVISLGGCSASFVSDQGLVVTNHHCAVGALQLNSSPEDNLLVDGFYAETMGDEIWAGPGSRVYVTEALTDVTDRILGAVPEDADDTERYAAMDRAEKELIAECEESDGYRCEVVSYYGGGEYRLVRQLEIEDVRLVLAPHEMVGFYGGDEDNWMWPRHVGDFSFFRAYVGPDGHPAPNAEENVPYQPAHYLTVSTAGVADGDFVMVAGYPGRTRRYATARQMGHAQERRYPFSIGAMEDILEILDAIMAADEEAEVRLGPFSFGVSNHLKNNRGMLDGFERSGVVAQVASSEAALLDWLDADDDRAHWRLEIEALDEEIEASLMTDERDRILGWTGWTVDLLNTAGRIYWLSIEREKDDLERDQGYQERDWPRLAERMERMDRRYVEAADRQLLTYFLRSSEALPETQRIPAFDDLLAAFSREDDPVSAAVDHLYAGTTLSDLETRLALLEADRETIEANEDPVLQLAVALYPMRREIRDESERRSGAFSRLRPAYIEALSAFRGGSIYPDANSTLRVTYGQVRGYQPRDGVWYTPLTTLPGIVEKHTDEEPFDAPDSLLTAIGSGWLGPYADDALGSVPVNFLSTLDTTGGNSGSVTLNARGELCGLLFDGNYEAMASDWLFDTVNTRSIQVDARYMLWMMDRVYVAHRVLLELGIEPAYAQE